MGAARGVRVLMRRRHWRQLLRRVLRGRRKPGVEAGLKLLGEVQQWVGPWGLLWASEVGVQQRWQRWLKMVVLGVREMRWRWMGA